VHSLRQLGKARGVNAGRTQESARGCTEPFASTESCKNGVRATAPKSGAAQCASFLHPASASDHGQNARGHKQTHAHARLLARSRTHARSTRAHTHARAHTRAHTHTRARAHTHTHTHTHFTHTARDGRTHTHTSARAQTTLACTHARTNARTHARTHTRTHVCARTHARTHSHTRRHNRSHSRQGTHLAPTHWPACQSPIPTAREAAARRFPAAGEWRGAPSTAVLCPRSALSSRARSPSRASSAHTLVKLELAFPSPSAPTWTQSRVGVTVRDETSKALAQSLRIVGRTLVAERRERGGAAATAWSLFASSPGHARASAPPRTGGSPVCGRTTSH